MPVSRSSRRVSPPEEGLTLGDVPAVPVGRPRCGFVPELDTRGRGRPKACVSTQRFRLQASALIRTGDDPRPVRRAAGGSGHRLHRDNLHAPEDPRGEPHGRHQDGGVRASSSLLSLGFGGRGPGSHAGPASTGHWLSPSEFPFPRVLKWRSHTYL